MRTYKLSAAVTSADNIANVTIQRQGRIRSIRWVTSFSDTTANHYMKLELSMQPVNQIGSNDTIGAIDELISWNLHGAAGELDTGKKAQSLVDFPVAVGERLYLNALSSMVAATATVFVDVEER